MGMSENRDARVATGISITAAIAAALAWINSRRAGAAPPGELVLPDEFVELIIAIASSSGKIDSGVQQIIQELATLAINVQGWPPNVKYIRSFTILCVAAGTPYPANELAVPSGMGLLIRSHPANALGSLVHVATSASECLNPNSSYPLQPSETVTYNIQNAREVYVSSTIAGSIVIFTAEQEM